MIIRTIQIIIKRNIRNHNNILLRTNKIGHLLSNEIHDTLVVLQYM